MSVRSSAAAAAIIFGFFSSSQIARSQESATAPIAFPPFMDQVEEQDLPAFSHGVVTPGDTCALAGEIEAVPFTASITLGDYSADGPPGSCNSGSPTFMSSDAWWTLTAPFDGLLNIDATFVNTAGIIVVHRGADCAMLTEAGCVSDTMGMNVQLIDVPITAGEQLWIQAGRLGTSGGGQNRMINLTVLAHPLNDECDGAVELIQGTPVLADTRLASENPADPVFSCRQEGAAPGVRTLWYSFVAESHGAGLSTCNTVGPATDSDSLLAVYSGECGALVEIACNDTGGCYPISGFASLNVTGLTPGTRYFVQLAAKTAASAREYQLDIVHFMPCPPGSLVEPGSCGGDFASDVNGGCNTSEAKPPTTPLLLGQTVCGQTSTEPCCGTGLARDLDWFEFEITQTTRISGCVRGQATAKFQLFIAPAECPAETIAFVNLGLGETGCLTELLEPGRYWFIVTVSYVQPIQPLACGQGNDYQFTLRAAPICGGDANGDGVVNFDDINAVIANWLADYSPGSGPGDSDSSSAVNFDDINSVIANWLSVCP